MLDRAELQALCERGSEELVGMRYLDAEATLSQAESAAFAVRDWDTLSRVYMPLQEARRQRRQRCGEGRVVMDLLARGAGDEPDSKQLAERYPNAQLLVAGWGSVRPAAELREIQRRREQYAETFLAAAYPIVGGSRAVVIVPLADVALPPAEERSIDALIRALPPHCVVMHENELPKGERAGTAETYAEVMALWERLHLPYLAAADTEVDGVRRIEGYRKAIAVDYACELAHQRASAVARELWRTRPQR